MRFIFWWLPKKKKGDFKRLALGVGFIIVKQEEHVFFKYFLKFLGRAWRGWAQVDPVDDFTFFK